MEEIETILEWLKVEPIYDKHGSGSGSGFGSDCGSGDGDGYGDGLQIKILNNEPVFDVDGIPTKIYHIHNNVAKGKIIDVYDFQEKPCYIAKGSKLFAHGKTLKQALEDLQEKIIDNLDVDEKIDEFRKIFNTKSKYSGNKFFEWHHILTGSCLMGRNQFVQSNRLDLKKRYSVKEFIEICENAYGGEIIKKLKEFYN